MNMPDVNILIYAHREDQDHHEFYAERLLNLLKSGEQVGLTPAVASGFVRVVTHAKFPNGPTPLPVALSFIESMILIPCCLWTGPGRQNWNLFFDLCRKTQARGKLVADAHHAATAIEHAGTWISRDTDFHRFVKHGLRFDPWTP